MQKNTAPILFLTSVALAGCSAVPHTATTHAYAKQRIELRAISGADLAKIQAITAESAEAVSQIDSGRGATESN